MMQEKFIDPEMTEAPKLQAKNFLASLSMQWEVT